MKQPVHEGDFSLFNRTLVHFAENPKLGEVETDKKQLSPEMRHYFMHQAQNLCDGHKTPLQFTLTDFDVRLYPELSGFEVVDLTTNCVREQCDS